MSSKSMVGMFFANHGSIGLRSNRFSALSRNFNIHSGSSLRSEISRTISVLRPFLGLKTFCSLSCQPSLYLPRSMPWTATCHRLLGGIVPPAAASSGGGAARRNFPLGGINTTQIVTIPGGPDNPGAARKPGSGPGHRGGRGLGPARHRCGRRTAGGGGRGGRRTRRLLREHVVGLIDECLDPLQVGGPLGDVA